MRVIFEAKNEFYFCITDNRSTFQNTSQPFTEPEPRTPSSNRSSIPCFSRPTPQPRQRGLNPEIGFRLIVRHRPTWGGRDGMLQHSNFERNTTVLMV